MAATGIERRIERLEKELGMSGERVVVRIRRFAEEGEVAQFRCGDRLYDRVPGETEARFVERVEREVVESREHSGLCVVLMETARRVPTLKIPMVKGGGNVAV